MSDSILILHPCNPNAVFSDVVLLEKKLNRAGFVGRIINTDDENYYKQGKRFFDYIIFDHSHDVIVLDAPNISVEDARVVDSKSRCYIHFPKSSASPEFIGAAGLESPTCPFCNQGSDNPYDLLSLWYENKNAFVWSCSYCKKVSSIYELDWKRLAGFARQQINIWNIHYGEAYPSKSFLLHLKKITGFDWTYFYYHL